MKQPAWSINHEAWAMRHEPSSMSHEPRARGHEPWPWAPCAASHETCTANHSCWAINQDRWTMNCALWTMSDCHCHVSMHLPPSQTAWRSCPQLSPPKRAIILPLCGPAGPKFQISKSDLPVKVIMTEPWRQGSCHADFHETLLANQGFSNSYIVILKTCSDKDKY